MKHQREWGKESQARDVFSKAKEVKATTWKRQCKLGGFSFAPLELVNVLTPCQMLMSQAISSHFHANAEVSGEDVEFPRSR